MSPGKHISHKVFLIYTLFTLISQIGLSQDSIYNTKDSIYITLVPGPQYVRGTFHQSMWGKHYRKEWGTPATFRIVALDTLYGGLKPYEAGGGRQSKTLRLRDANNKEYVLRSIDKSYGRALPDLYRRTFIEKIINDQVSTVHAYAALTIPEMAAAAKIYHTNPVIVYVPKHDALGEFNDEYGNTLYLFEQRPDNDWSDASNFGNASKIVSTDHMLEKIKEENDHLIDQEMYVRSRVFDILVGDWGRHEDQWRWAVFDENGNKIYRPIPRDRDQTFTLFDGKLLGAALSAAGLGHLQSFDYSIKDINGFNFSARHLDRVATNKTTLEDWTRIASEMQEAVSEDVIDEAILNLPAEVYTISGREIGSKIKARRNHLVDYARDYYLFLAEAVDITGTEQKEKFDIVRNDSTTVINIFRVKKEQTESLPYYTRIFSNNQTKEIRIYGMGDDDVFNISGTANDAIKIRLIPGTGNDVLNDQSNISGGKKTNIVYDDDKTNFSSNGETRYKIKNDTAVHRYNYNEFTFEKSGLYVVPGLIGITIGYKSTTEGFRKKPHAAEHHTRFRYSVNRGARNLDHTSVFYQAIGNWNYFIGGGAGFPMVENFFGTGNETTTAFVTRKYHRLRRNEFYGRTGIMIGEGQGHHAKLFGFYETVQLKQDDDRIVKDFMNGTTGFDTKRKHFAGAQVEYQFVKTNDPIIPTGGINFQSSASYTLNMQATEKSFTRVAADLGIYIPVFKPVSFAFRFGGASNSSETEIYQMNKLGSHDNLRGYRKQRFYGKSMAYNNNEIRFIINTRNSLFNGKFGFVPFYDIGRVWNPGEVSDKWHKGYGLSVFISPFNRFIISGAYGTSSEDGRVLSAYFGFYF